MKNELHRITSLEDRNPIPKYVVEERLTGGYRLYQRVKKRYSFHEGGGFDYWNPEEIGRCKTKKKLDQVVRAFSDRGESVYIIHQLDADRSGESSNE